MTDIVSGVLAVLAGSQMIIPQLIQTYGYLGIFILMILEGMSLPVPSEVIIPITGYLIANHMLNLYISFIAVLAGNIVGITIAYAIGFFIGKELVYKHLGFFHIRKERLEAFDSWFERNGSAAVFLGRMLPVVRGLISFPAGFAKMGFPRFLLYSIAGSAIWDFVLLAYGYYVLSVHNSLLVAASVGVFVLVLYLLYYFAARHIKKR